MRGKRGNFFISPRVLLWSCSTFIMLSVAATERQCYWCGPLAEQVHRSRRAPPCDVPTAHLTTCEVGLMHCAVVATAPPHVESRFCVKLYQDECYPLFCNSTKTWKMTCPCRGNLCNGNNTEREIEAFAVLSKLVAKSQNVRIKKRASDESNFISSDRQRTIIITNITQLPLNKTNNEANEIGNSERMIVVSSTVREDTEIPSTDSPTKKTIEVSLSTAIPEGSRQKLEQYNHSTEGTTVQAIDTTHHENLTAVPNIDLNVQSDPSTISDRTDTIETASTIADIFEETETAEANIAKEPEPTKNDINEMTNMETHTNILHSKAIPSEQLPTAEALQQNDIPSPISKTTEDIKADSTEPSTFETEDSTTVQPTKASASYIYLMPTYIYLITLGSLLVSH